MTHARLTTVLPTYRRPAMLLRAIESVLAQGREDVEVKVFDNASGDGTEALVRGLAATDARVVYHRHATNIGGTANFEFGLRSVSTEFFSILSDDDYLLPGFYDRAIASLDENPDVMFWAGTTLHVDEEGTVIDARVDAWARHGRFEGEFGVLAMTGGRAPTWTGIVFRRAALDRLGPPDREAGGPGDFHFVLRLAAHYPYIVERHPSAVFTLNTASFSAVQPLSSFWPGLQYIATDARSWDGLDVDARGRVALALNHDATRFVFRRGVHALVHGRRDFAHDAVRALQGVQGVRALSVLLRAGLVATAVPGIRILLARLYRRLETRLVRSRNDLQLRFGSLLRRVGPTERR